VKINQSSKYQDQRSLGSKLIDDTQTNTAAYTPDRLLYLHH